MKRMRAYASLVYALSLGNVKCFLPDINDKWYDYNISLTEVFMRLDKYLKVSRLIKRRTVANEACDSERVMINNKIAKASANVKVGDIINIKFGNKEVNVEVLQVSETVKKEDAQNMYKML